MSEYTAWFDGHDLSDLFTIAPPTRQLTTWEPTLVESVTGSMATGTKAQPMEVTLLLATFAKTERGRLDALRTLSGWLAVDEPKMLVLTDEIINQITGQEKYSYALRYAMPSGEISVERYLNAMTATVRFVCPDPRAYQTMYSFSPSTSDTNPLNTLLSDGFVRTSMDSVSQSIIGTAPTRPRFTFNGLHGDSSGKFTMRVIHTEGSAQKTQLISLDVASDVSSTVEIDMERRALTVDGIVTFDAGIDWLDLIPGMTYDTPYNANYTFDFPSGGWDRMSLLYYPRWW